VAAYAPLSEVQGSRVQTLRTAGGCPEYAYSALLSAVLGSKIVVSPVSCGRSRVLAESTISSRFIVTLTETAETVGYGRSPMLSNLSFVILFMLR
jgi:hypothetical protein